MVQHEVEHVIDVDEIYEKWSTDTPDNRHLYDKMVQDAIKIINGMCPSFRFDRLEVKPVDREIILHGFVYSTALGSVKMSHYDVPIDFLDVALFTKLFRGENVASEMGGS